MKKKKVKKEMYRIRKRMINGIDEIPKIPGITDNWKGPEMWAYQIGVSRAATILLDGIKEMFPEEKE